MLVINIYRKSFANLIFGVKLGHGAKKRTVCGFHNIQYSHLCRPHKIPACVLLDGFHLDSGFQSLGQLMLAGQLVPPGDECGSKEVCARGCYCHYAPA